MTETTSNRYRYDLLAGMTELERLYCKDQDKFLKELSEACLREVDCDPDDESAKNHTQKFSKECDWIDEFDLSLYNTNGFDGGVDTPKIEDVRLIQKQEWGQIHDRINWYIDDSPSSIDVERVHHRAYGLSFSNPSEAFLTYTNGDVS